MKHQDARFWVESVLVFSICYRIFSSKPIPLHLYGRQQRVVGYLHAEPLVVERGQVASAAVEAEVLPLTQLRERLVGRSLCTRTAQSTTVSPQLAQLIPTNKTCRCERKHEARRDELENKLLRRRRLPRNTATCTGQTHAGLTPRSTDKCIDWENIICKRSAPQR